LFLSGCSLFPSQAPIKQIEISTKPVERPKLVVPSADELNLREIDWVVLTEENFEEKVKEISDLGRPVVFFALTDKGYENLGLNFSDLRAYVQQQQAIIAAYKKYYVEAEKSLDKAVEID
jgi:hypothetical protein